MNKSESIKEIAAALNKFIGDVKQPKKNSKVSTNYKDKYGNWQKKEYSYSTLDELINSIKEPLHNNGLSVMQDVQTNGEIKITTLLMHVSGEWLESSPVTFQIPDNKPQTVGSLITYGRRYSLSAMLNLSSEEDTDSIEVQEQAEQQEQQRQPYQNKQQRPQQQPQVPLDQLPPEQRPPLKDRNPSQVHKPYHDLKQQEYDILEMRYEQGMGSNEGFADWATKQLYKGRTYDSMLLILNKAISQKMDQQQGEQEQEQRPEQEAI